MPGTHSGEQSSGWWFEWLINTRRLESMSLVLVGDSRVASQMGFFSTFLWPPNKPTHDPFLVNTTWAFPLEFFPPPGPVSHGSSVSSSTDDAEKRSSETSHFFSLQIIPSKCCCSVAQLCLTLCNPMDCSTPGFLLRYSMVLIKTILKDDAVKVLHSICQQIWKTQQ